MENPIDALVFARSSVKLLRDERDEYRERAEKLERALYMVRSLSFSGRPSPVLRRVAEVIAEALEPTP